MADGPIDLLDNVVRVLKERENNYDHPLDNFKRISAFDVIINEAPDGPEKVALRNIGQKMARLIYALIVTRNRPATPEEWKAIVDGWTDIAGYAICGLRCSEVIQNVKLRSPRI